MAGGKSKTLLYFFRHGEVMEEFKNRFYGQMDVPLSPKGLEQSKNVAERLKAIGFDAVYSSDLQRAGKLADALADPLDLPVRRLEVFRERHFGILQGLTEEEMEEQHPEHYRMWKANRVLAPIEGGETYNDLSARIVPAVQTLVEAFPGGRIALVAHGGPIRVTLANVLEMPLENVFRLTLDYACVNVIEFPAQGPPRVKLING